VCIETHDDTYNETNVSHPVTETRNNNNKYSTIIEIFNSYKNIQQKYKYSTKIKVAYYNYYT